MPSSSGSQEMYSTFRNPAYVNAPASKINADSASLAIPMEARNSSGMALRYSSKLTPVFSSDG